MVTLTPLAVQNGPLLRLIGQADEAVTQTPTVAELAASIDRDVENVRKSLKALAAAGLLAKAEGVAGSGYFLTAEGMEVREALDRAEGAASPQPAGAGVEVMIPHQLIVPDLLNPRKHFDEEAIAELAATLLADGQLQNLVVRPAAPMENYSQDMHRLVAGERRWRAAALLIKRGDWPADATMRCLVRDIDDETHARLALIENLQRKDLRPLDEARAFKRLVDDHGYTTAKLSEEIKFTQRFVQQRLQLLELSEVDQERLEAGKITIEQARQIIANRPEPVEISPVEVLALVELLYKANADSPGLNEWLKTERDPYAEQDPVFAAVTSKRWVVEGYAGDGRTYSRLDWSAWRILNNQFPQVVVAPGKRAAALAALREAACLDAPAEGQFSMPWLNGPWDITAEAQAQLDADEAERAEAAKRHEAAQAEAVRQAQIALAPANEALARLKEAPPAQPITEHLLIGMSALGRPLPWRFDHYGRVVAADGRVMDFGNPWGALDKARVRLTVAAINAAAGMATPDDLPEPSAETEPDEDVEADDDSVDAEDLEPEDLEAAE